MSETTFTPGPWKLNGHYIEARSGLCVTRIAIVDDGAGTLPGNGPILAAAPDMHGALHELVAVAAPYLTDEMGKLALQKAREALAKAKEGE